MAGVTRSPTNHTEARLDDVSKAIIEQLQEDGRQSYATIAKQVGLSEAAVRQRVQRLLDSGVMQIVAVTDPLQVGFRRQAMIGIRVDGDLTSVGDASPRPAAPTTSPRSCARTTTSCWNFSRSGCGPFPGSSPPRPLST
jgi:DNA-binding Lrp family transcriptional regulator